MVSINLSYDTMLLITIKAKAYKEWINNVCQG